MQTGDETTTVEGKPAIPASQQIEEAYLDCLLSGMEQISATPVIVAGGEEENNLPCNMQMDAQLDTRLNTADSFQCRLLHSCGINIAVPLDEVSQIIDIPENMEINNRLTSLCYGTFEWQNKQIFILRMPLIIFEHSDGMQHVSENEQKIMLLKNKNIAFMCNEIPGIVRVNPREVTWRDSNSRRLWLAGMMAEQGYAILDPEGLLQLMMNWGKKHD